MKQKTVQARLPEDLFDNIVTKAKKNRTTVSGLIRNLVEDFLEISEDLTDLASEKTRKFFFQQEKGELLGSQPFTLLRKTTCSSCDRELAKGAKVQLAFYENSTRGAVICPDCLAEESSSAKKE